MRTSDVTLERVRARIADVAVVPVLWTAGAVALAAGYSSGAVGEGSAAVPFAERLVHFLPFYWVWAALTPAIVALSRRVSRSGAAWPVATAWHAAAAIACAAFHVVCYVPLSLTVSGGWGTAPLGWHVWTTLLRHLPGNLLTYACVVLIWIGADYRRRMRDELTRARLDALRAQLHPHFLFNSLQVASSLVRDDPDAAEDLLEQLGDFLRAVLRRDSRELVPLSEELDLLEHYLAIMRLRFRDRLSVALHVDESVREARVPVLLLQPLVENALRHGIGRRPRGGHLDVVAERRGNRLLLRVEDDGPGLADVASITDHVGIGLANTAARLRHHFGDEQSVRLSKSRSGGFLVEVETPLQLEPSRSA